MIRISSSLTITPMYNEQRIIIVDEFIYFSISKTQEIKLKKRTQ